MEYFIILKEEEEHLVVDTHNLRTQNAEAGEI